MVIYGFLYNWYAATDVREIANTGWHVPGNDDWNTLRTYFGDDATAGGKIKEIGTVYWDAPNTGATNEVGFNGRGAGVRNSTTGIYAGLNLVSRIWSSVESGVNPNKGKLLEISYLLASTLFPTLGGYASIDKNTGCSVRLIKDSTTLTHGQTGTYTGNDGKVYNTICIGTQEWLSENLCETKYHNGDDITIVTDNTAWAALTTEAMCYYDNDIDNAYIQDIITTTISPTTTLLPMRGITISHKLPSRITSTDITPSVTFVVIPAVDSCFEFIDMFISASYKPYRVEVAVDKDFTDSITIPQSKIITYNDGWYHIKRLPKTAGGKVLIGGALFVKITFEDNTRFYDLKFVKTGYREITGG